MISDWQDFLSSMDPFMTLVVSLAVSSTAALAWIAGRDR